MDSRQRVTAALQHRQPDRTPYTIGFTQKAFARMLEHPQGERYLELIDNDIVSLGAGPGPLDRWLSETVHQDEFGVQWDRSVDRDIGVVCNCLLPERDLSALRLPDPHAPEKFADLAQRVAQARAAGKFVVFSIGFSLFERAWTLRGMERLLVDMLEAPGFVDELLDRICDWNIAVVQQAVRYDIDMVHFGDDWGSQRGLIMGPQLWERFLLPRLQRQYHAVKEAGKFVSIHSCGQVQEIFPQLIAAGLDCFNPFQPEVMDPYQMKARFGDRLSFWGGISTQRLLPYGTPEEVRAEVRRLLAEVGRGGGYIAAPAHAIPGDARPENIIAMIETLNDQ